MRLSRDGWGKAVFYIRAADLLIRVDNLYPYLESACADYIVQPDREPDAVIRSDLEMVKESLDWHRKNMNMAVDPGFAEYSRIHQELYPQIVRFGAFWMHAAVIGMDGNAYGFTAPVGGGKSTHVGLWKQVYGDRVRVINGDNPVIRRKDGVFCAFGTPFGGSPGDQTNTGLPLKGICFLRRGEHNSITPMDPEEARNRILKDLIAYQAVRIGTFRRFLRLTDEFAAEVPAYTLVCNMDPEAAVIAYREMAGTKLREDGSAFPSVPGSPAGKGEVPGTAGLFVFLLRSRFYRFRLEVLRRTMRVIRSFAVR